MRGGGEGGRGEREGGLVCLMVMVAILVMTVMMVAGVVVYGGHLCVGGGGDGENLYVN